MKIMLLNNLYPPYILGGAEIVMGDMAEGLKKRGHEVIVVTSSYGLSHPQREDSIWRALQYAPPAHFDSSCSLPLRLVSLGNYYRGYHNPFNAKAMRELLHRTQPDVICVSEITGLGINSLFSVLLELKIPIVFYLQSYWLLYLHSPETAQSRLKARWLKKLLIGPIPPLKYTSLIAVSDAVRKIYQAAGYNPEKFDIIYNGVYQHFIDTPQTLNTHTGASASSQENGKSTELLFVGRLCVEKGVLVLLKALDILINKQGRKHIHVSIIGDGDAAYVRELQLFIRNYGLNNVVTFEGRITQNELLLFYDKASIMLMPSIWPEPFALAAGEAMARGVPVIASNAGGTAERITHDVDGLLVPPGDEQALASAITFLLDHPDQRSRLGQAAYATVRTHFTVEASVKRVEQHLQEIILQGHHLLRDSSFEGTGRLLMND